MDIKNSASHIWNIAETLRGAYRATDYGKIILPFTLLRRIDAFLEPGKQAFLEEWDNRTDENLSEPDNLTDAMLKSVSVEEGLNGAYNYSPWTFSGSLNEDADTVYSRLKQIVSSYSSEVKSIFASYELDRHIDNLHKNNLLTHVVSKFLSVDLSAEALSNIEMGAMFEELIRKFAEDSAADNGEFFTPREIIHLATMLALRPHDKQIHSENLPLNIYDPTAGTGGFLTEAEDKILSKNPDANVYLFGQELNPESHAICQSDMLLKGKEIENIRQGNTLSQDKHHGAKFDYILANPPYGSDWNSSYNDVLREAGEEGSRFSHGLPKRSDGQLLFLSHIAHKLYDPAPNQRGGRAAVVLNGSSLFTGDAGSGESRIREWLLTNDYVDAIIELPTSMFYNTGISTYIWVLDKEKPVERQGKVALIDASNEFTKMRKNMGEKSSMLSEENSERIVDTYLTYGDKEKADLPIKIFEVAELGYRTITVEHPLRKKYEISDETISALIHSDKWEKIEYSRQRFIEEVVKEVPVLQKREVFGSRNLLDEVLQSAHHAVFFRQLGHGSNSASKPFTAISGSHDRARKAVLKKLTKAEKDMLALAFATNARGKGDVSKDAKGNIIPDPEQRENETVPLVETIASYIEREVLPYDEEAWIDESKTKIGYEVLFNKYFYVKEETRSLAEIDEALEKKVASIAQLLGLHVVTETGSEVKANGEEN